MAIDQETGPAEMRCQPKGALEAPGKDAIGFKKLPVKNVKCSLALARAEEIIPAIA
jgi:hypothetical protein